MKRSWRICDEEELEDLSVEMSLIAEQVVSLKHQDPVASELTTATAAALDHRAALERRREEARGGARRPETSLEPSPSCERCDMSAGRWRSLELRSSVCGRGCSWRRSEVGGRSLYEDSHVRNSHV
ncbi:hypothetical protein EYF80_066725 [Liparis tanakae]|uniref:Uncharacterized protein n=1 Tax=Liparis tanakae TaxID=230148 RepID=A0A4Z2E325_9TELE|nr:hypothetical protein EYF80_066725 [Liparis tanakae]